MLNASTGIINLCLISIIIPTKVRFKCVIYCVDIDTLHSSNVAELKCINLHTKPSVKFAFYL